MARSECAMTTVEEPAEDFDAVPGDVDEGVGRGRCREGYFGSIMDPPPRAATASTARWMAAVESLAPGVCAVVDGVDAHEAYRA